MLYWFRTPPGVKVGRSALDEDAIRLIEEFNPGVGFDWTRILKGQGAPAEERQEQQPRRSPTPSRGGAPRTPPQTVSAPAEAPPDREDALDVAMAIDDTPTAESLDIATKADAPREEIPPTPAHARLGSEAVSRLRARHAEMLARISETVADPARRDELTSQADRLNPDTWVTAEEVSAALEQYESVFASLRAVVGHGRRRRRRGRRGPSRPNQPSAQAGQELADASPPGGDEDDGSGSEET